MADQPKDPEVEAAEERRIKRLIDEELNRYSELHREVRRIERLIAASKGQ